MCVVGGSPDGGQHELQLTEGKSIPAREEGTFSEMQQEGR